jgi:hypothetical protein
LRPAQGRRDERADGGRVVVDGLFAEQEEGGGLAAGQRGQDGRDGAWGRGRVRVGGPDGDVDGAVRAQGEGGAQLVLCLLREEGV